MDRLSAPGQEPCSKQPGIADSTVSPAVAGAIAAALFARERTGVGQKVEISLYEYAVWALSFDIGTALNQGVNLPQADRQTAQNVLWNYYQAKDGKWVMLVMPQTDQYWSSFCRAIGKLEWEKDIRFDPHDKRMEQNVTLISALDNIMSSKTVAEREAIAREHNLVVERIQSPVEVANDPQAWENDFFSEMEYGPGVQLKMINSPIRFSKTPASARLPAPELGQHTDAILRELEYAGDDIAELRSHGIIM